MAITLAEAKVGMADHVDQQIIDMFQRSSLLLDNLTFDNSISPGTGGSTLTYGYVQLQTPSTAGVREINSEYTPNEAKRVEKTTKAIIMGGSFQLDRVIQATSGAVDELAFQTQQKVLATANEFHYYVINGTAAASGAGYATKTFDGLRKLLSGTTNEFTTTIDLSTAAAVDSNYAAFLDELDALVHAVDGTPSMLMMNGDMLLKVRSAARRAGYYERNKDDFGRVVETYSGIPLVDLGKYYNGSASVDAVSTSTAGKTAIYAVSLGLDGFHGISPTGTSLIQSYMPDLTAPGAVKTGEVELVAGVALKNTLKAAVLDGIGIKAAS
jgi:hypothetical protein